MNDAHIHLLVNHVPIVGLLIGILVLLAGMLLKKAEVKITAMAIFIFSALASIVTFYSGEGAEEVLENLAGYSETLMHLHEEDAEAFFMLTLILGSLSFITLIAEIKKAKFSKYLMILCLLVALTDGVLATFAGNSGGEITHKEIRNEAKIIEINR
ncbi:hypothetical protein GCM10011506_04320 [Marivirga lumbricoides]|uniref:NADH-quinone oxidoreductase subunit N n=1 Tax=Marivirga lumbricoides TaxID=1046115 RepID=A0ABQ1LE52_9BACT|nr:hypothetical protein GCM10011506_04320 [Marivirga lumbricoides]